MVMVDRLLLAAGNETVTAFVIRPENVFVEDGFFTEPGLIENMAQTAAAGSGARQDPGAKPRTGFIGGIRDLVIYELPATGDEIITKVTVEHTVMDASVVEAEVLLNGMIIAKCNLKIFLISQA
jgi:predicted hotdog family 3-hydroxylacyl-ACP dehydratase